MRCIILSAVSAALLWGCNQNAIDVRDGLTLADAPKPVADNAKPLAGAPGAGRGMPDIEKTMAKAYFMHKFVDALYSVPKNPDPNPKWSSPLKDPDKGRVVCADCHDSRKMDMSRIPAERTAKAEELEKDHEFMVELMTKWVGRLNSGDFDAKGKLKQTVACTTCHATDPRDR